MNMYKTFSLGLVFIGVLLPACSSGSGAGAGAGAPVVAGNPSTIVLDKVIPPGDRCPNGGIQVDAGIDDNGNGVLDPEEVDVSEVVCNGVDGATGTTGSVGNNALIRVSDELAGENCEKGGSKIEVGLDTNGNDILDVEEINSARTHFICLPVLPSFKGLVFTADKNLTGMVELFRAEADGSEIVKLAGPLTALQSVQVFRISPDKTRVAFTSDFETDNVTELFVVNLMDGTRPVKVNGPLVSGGIVGGLFQWSPDGKRILYDADQETDNVSELFTSFADGTGNVKVNGPIVIGGDITGYSWSPDSKRIVYVADQETDNVFELFTVFPDGTGNIKVNGPLIPGVGVGLNSNAWSPDSNRIAYHVGGFIGAAHVSELFTVFPEGTGNVKINRSLLPDEFVAEFFSWSPDSSRLSHKIVGKRNNSSFSELFTSLPDGTDKIKVSGPLPPDGGVGTFSWSPDSTRIAYLAGGKIGGAFVFELFTSFADGRDNVKVSQALLPNERISGLFRWAPNSAHIAYKVGKNVNQDESLYVTNPLDGLSPVKLNGPDGGVGDLSWSPDSTRIAYELHDVTNNSVSLGLFTSFPDGTGNTKISAPFVLGGRVIRFSWSPDGLRIAYYADQETDNIFELFTAIPDGTENIKVSGPLASGGRVFVYSW